jgi:hypothetical protein
MRKKALLLLVILVGIIRCSNKDPGEIVLSTNHEKQSSEIPLEIDPNQLKGSADILIAQSVGNLNEQFILQKCRSLFYSNDENTKVTYCTILTPSISESNFKLKKSSQASIFTFTENDNGQLNLSEQGEPILTYNFGMQLKEGVKERYRRSSYIHPIYDTKGNRLTDDFPVDHYHHRGVFWVWPKVYIDKKRYDLWHIYGQDGTLDGIHQVFEDWLYKKTGPVCAEFGVKNCWQLENNQKVMDEWIFVRIFKATDKNRAIDIQLVLKPTIPLTLEGQTTKGYGGFNFRFAPRTETQITSHHGKEMDSDLKHLTWADESAKFAENDYFSGVSIFQHKNNIDFPAGWCLRHYGFLGVAWPGVEPYSMTPGKPLSLSFRIWIHQGDAETGQVKPAYTVFENPPLITKE